MRLQGFRNGQREITLFDSRSVVVYMDILGPGVHDGDRALAVPVGTPALLLFSGHPPLLPLPHHAQTQQNATGNQGQEDEDCTHRDDGDDVSALHEALQDI